MTLEMVSLLPELSSLAAADGVTLTIFASESKSNSSVTASSVFPEL